MAEASIPTPGMPASAAKGNILMGIAELWHHKRQKNQAPSLLDFNPAAMFLANGHIAVVDVEPDSKRLKYRSIGVRIRARIRPMEAEGRYLDEHLPSGASLTLLPVLRHAIDNIQPIYLPAMSWLADVWPETGCLVLPLATYGRDIDQIMLIFALASDEQLPRVMIASPPVCEIASPGFKVPEPPLEQLLSLWRAACEGDKLPRKVFVDPFALKFILGNLVLFEIEPVTGLARYRLSGIHIVDRVGMDLTGARVVDLKDDQMAIEVQSAVNYCIAARQPLFVSSSRLVQKVEVKFTGVLLPISDDGLNVTHVLTGQLYESAAPRWRRSDPEI